MYADEDRSGNRTDHVLHPLGEFDDLLEGRSRNANIICTPSTEYFDILSALGHELGHVRGLDHVVPPGAPGCSIMTEQLVPADQSNVAGPYEFPRTPLPRDVKTMQRMYGV